MRKYILLLLIPLLLLCACAAPQALPPPEEQEILEEPPVEEPPTEVPEAETAAPEPRRMTAAEEAELDYFNSEDFFNGEAINIRNQFLSSLYDAPEQINLFELFYCGSGLPESKTEAEIEAVIAYNEWDYRPDCACEKNSRASLDAVLLEYTGLTLAETDGIGLENFTYLEEYDAYYYFHGDSNYRPAVEFSRLEREGDTLRLTYYDNYMGDGKKMLTLREQDGNYFFVANQRF